MNKKLVYFEDCSHYQCSNQGNPCSTKTLSLCVSSLQMRLHDLVLTAPTKHLREPKCNWPDTVHNTCDSKKHLYRCINRIPSQPMQPPPLAEVPPHSLPPTVPPHSSPPQSSPTVPPTVPPTAPPTVPPQSSSTVPTVPPQSLQRLLKVAEVGRDCSALWRRFAKKNPKGPRTVAAKAAAW